MKSLFRINRNVNEDLISIQNDRNKLENTINNYTTRGRECLSILSEQLQIINVQ